MLVRLMGATSNPSSAWLSSSSWKARFNASIAAKVNVTHRMLGARSIAATAVGSRPKLNTMRTSAVNTTAERIAVRVRNSSTRSLRASVHAWRSVSTTGPRPPGGRAPRLVRSILQPRAAQRLAHAGPPQRGRHVVQGGPEKQVLPHREMPVQVRLMPHPANRARPTLHVRRAGLRADQSDEYLEQRRLAGAVRPEDRERLPGSEMEGNVVQRPHATEGVPQSLNPQHRCARPGRPC